MNKLAILLPFILASCVGAPAPAIADELWIQGHVASKHFKQGKYISWNETNPGIGIRYVDGSFAYQVGTFFNSVNLKSNYAFIDWRTSKYGPYSAGIFAGVVDGYSPTPSSVLGLGGAYVTLVEKNSSVTLRFIPSLKNSVGFVALEFGKRFW